MKKIYNQNISNNDNPFMNFITEQTNKNIINKNKNIHKKNINKNKKYKIICNNCGKRGHVYKKCEEPNMSLGIICYRIINNNIQFLMICRKNTYSYVEFILGNYSLQNIDYLKKIIENMTKIEIMKILNYKFDSLWADFWSIKKINTKKLKNNSIIDDTFNLKLDDFKSSKNKTNFIKSKNKFNELKKLNILNNLISDTPPKWDSPEWGFPKGRRNIKESDEKCAIREFKEETNLKENNFIIRKDIDPFIEIYNGSNNLKYKHKYYIAEINKKNKYNNYLKTRNSNQRIEISDINWFSYNDALDKIRPYHYRKCQILTRLYLLLNNKLKFKSNYIKSKKNNTIKNFIFKDKKNKDNNIVKYKK